MQGEYEIIIVDYNCPMGCGTYFEKTFSNQTKIVRANVGVREWNLSHARNLGYEISAGDALLFIDADTMIKSNFLSAHILRENEFYTGRWLHCSGCCMLWKKDFGAIKGYNEYVDGWGSEDYDLYRRLEAKGLKRNYFNEKLFKNIQHHDKIRNEYHGFQNIHVTNERNYQRTIKEFKSCLE